MTNPTGARMAAGDDDAVVHSACPDAGDCTSDMEIPLVTVVIPAYNAQATLAEAMESVYAQAGARIDLVVVDDGSADDTLRVASERAARHPHTTVLTQENSGTCGALNAGFAVARGRFVAALGADDELTPDYLTTMSAFIAANPGFDIYGPDIWMVRPDGLKRRAFRWTKPRSLTLCDILPRSLISGGGTFISRELLQRLDGFRAIRRSEDYDFWLRALADGARHVYVPAPLYLYRESLEQKTADVVATLESNIASIEHLMKSAELDEHAHRCAVSAIATRRAEIERAAALGGKTEHQVVAAHAARNLDRMRLTIGRVLPATAADAVMRALYSMRWLVRPFRKTIWWLRFRFTRGVGR